VSADISAKPPATGAITPAVMNALTEFFLKWASVTWCCAMRYVFSWYFPLASCYHLVTTVHAKPERTAG
jgi:hypothetical protein